MKLNVFVKTMCATISILHGYIDEKPYIISYISIQLKYQVIRILYLWNTSYDGWLHIVNWATTFFR